MTICYLHIGTEKTGTTSLQNFFHKNTDRLIQQGIWYSRVLGRPSSRLIAIYGRDSDKPDDGFARNNITNAEQHIEFRAALERNLKNEIDAFRDSGCTKFIISSEHCHSRLTSVEMVQRVRNLLEPHFNSTRVICFLRPQLDMRISLASTAARVGIAVNQGYFEIDENSMSYNFRLLIDRWTNVYPKEFVTLVPYNRYKDTVQYFINLLGIDTDPLLLVPSVNESLDISTIAIFNAILACSGSKCPGNVQRILDGLPVHQKIRLSKAMATRIQNKFAESNATVCNKFPGIKPEDLTPDWSSYEESGNLELLELPDYLKKTLVQLILNLAGKTGR